jgi:uncharacterized protein DUF6340
MKKRYSFSLFVSAVIASFVFTGCSKLGYVSLKYPTAPTVTLPQSIKSIAVVNRSTVEKENNNPIIEAIGTGEVAGSDKRASNESLRGVYDRMNGWRATSIVIPTHTRLYGTGTRVLPPVLEWNVVKNICDSTGTNALLVLETFDSNSDMLLGNVANQLGALATGNAPPPPNRQVKVNIVSYWRFYDPSTKTIIDESQTNSYINFDLGALTMAPPEALTQAAYEAGQEYIERFLPGFYYVRRDVYKKGKGDDKDKFSAAFRKTEVANWEGAMEIWSGLTKSSNATNAGRACLNMAVGCEVLGRTEEAIVWAKKGYEDHGNKISRDYANQLRSRLNDE